MDLLLSGVILFNGGQYFEAHEVWEDLWRATADPALKRAYQGLIHAAVGLHHLHRGNTVGARSQLQKALIRLTGAPCDIHGLDSADLIRQLETALERMEVERIRIRVNV